MSQRARIVRSSFLVLALAGPLGLAACEAEVDVEGTPSARPDVEPTAPYDIEKRIDFPADPDGSSTIELAGQCLPSPVALTNANEPDCVVLDLREADTCACDPASDLTELSAAHAAALAQAEKDGYAPPASNCACEVEPITAAADLAHCESSAAPPTDANGNPLQGWCYVDPAASPPRGTEELVEACGGQPRKIRFLGAPARAAATAKTLLVLCRAEASGG